MLLLIFSTLDEPFNDDYTVEDEDDYFDDYDEAFEPQFLDDYELFD